MLFIEKLLIFLACLGFAILILKYPLQIVRIVGKMSWAENRLGPGGTFTVWKLIAVLLIVGSLIFVTQVSW